VTGRAQMRGGGSTSPRSATGERHHCSTRRFSPVSTTVVALYSCISPTLIVLREGRERRLGLARDREPDPRGSVRL